MAAYATPTVAVAGLNPVEVIESGCVAALTVSESVFEVVFCGLLLSRTVTVTLNVPAAVGVPYGAPEVAWMLIPLGKPVADQL